MENRNNSVHYKMYKSGKSVVYAGLVTTAALAGLTLANTNATTVHADEGAPQTEQVAAVANQTANNSATPVTTTATSTEIQSQQAVVNSASNDVASQQAVVNSASAALSDAQQLNAGSTAVSQAQDAFNNAHKAYSDAQTAQWAAHSKAHDANVQVSDAQEWVDFWNNGGEEKYNDINNQISDAQATVNSLSNAQSDFEVARAALRAANQNPATDKTSTEYQALQSTYDLAESNLKTYNAAKAKIASLNNKLNGKENVIYQGSSQPIDFVYGKKTVDGFDALKAKADQLNKAYNDAVAATDAAAKISMSKKQELQKVRDQYLIYTPAQLKDLATKATHAQNQLNINKTKLDALTTKDGNTYSSAKEFAKEANTKLENAKSDFNVAQQQLNKLQDAVNNATTDETRHNAEHALNQWKNGAYKTAQDNLNTKKAKADYWNGQVKEIESSDAYADLQKSNTAMQKVVDDYNQAKINSANADKAAAQVAPLQAAYDASVNTLNAYKKVLADAEAKLAAMKGDNNQNSGSNSNANSGSNNNSNANSGANNNSNANSGANNSNANSGANNGNANSGSNNAANGAVNGNHASSAANGSVAGTNASVSGSRVEFASVNASNAASNANSASANNLPQTGNENNAAVIALGAVSAMFGLGLAAKKREF